MARRSIVVEDIKKLGKPDGWRLLPCENVFFCTFNYYLGDHQRRGGTSETWRTTKDVILSDPVDNISLFDIIENSTHRDGSIYKKHISFLNIFRVTDRNETSLEPMALSEPTDCQPDREGCLVHARANMLQIFSLKLAQIPIEYNSIELYGYLAVRDSQDSLLNYIVNRSRDDPIIVQQGSLIEMTGPKRAISMLCSALVEFDMRIKNGEKEDDDLQLIDGAIEICYISTSLIPFRGRIGGNYGAVDMTLALVDGAVEATIEVFMSEVQGSFSLSLSSIVSISGLHEEFQLFDGIIVESCGLRRFVISVEMNTWLHLKLRIGQKDSKDGCHCSFKARYHGCASQNIVVDLASFSMKVTWSTVP